MSVSISRTFLRSLGYVININGHQYGQKSPEKHRCFVGIEKIVEKAMCQISNKPNCDPQ
jgi:hypothetical protein